MLLAAGILMVVAWIVSIAAVHTIDKDFLSKNLGPPCVGANGKRSFQSVIAQSGNAKKSEFKYVIPNTSFCTIGSVTGGNISLTNQQEFQAQRRQ